MRLGGGRLLRERSKARSVVGGADIVKIPEMLISVWWWGMDSIEQDGKHQK